MTPFPICGARARWKTAQKMVLLSANEPCHFCGSKKSNTTLIMFLFRPGSEKVPQQSTDSSKTLNLASYDQRPKNENERNKTQKKNCRKIT